MNLPGGERSWVDPELVGLGRLPTRSPLVAFPDAADALSQPREASPWFLSLDGAWRFHLCERPEQVPGHFSDPKLDDGDWAEIQVPGNWMLQGYDVPRYTNVQMPFAGEPPDVPDDNPTGLYRRRFTMPTSWRGKRVVAHFGGAESVLYVWLNGQGLGLSKDSRLPAEFDLTPHLVPGENTLAAMVVRWSDASYLEDQDHWSMAGLHREVYLYATGDVHIADVRVRAPLNLEQHTGTLDVRVEVGGPSRAIPEHSVRLELFDPRGRAVFRKPPEGPLPAAGNPYLFEGHFADFIETIRAPRPWSAERPDLYTVVVSLLDASGRCAEAVSVRTGFRRVEIQERELLVNGRPVMIKGVNRHDHHPTRGKALKREDIRRDVVSIKQWGFNAIRTAHYPNDPYLYDLCDELGLYVVDEANVEAHAHLASLCHDPRYTRAFVERGQRMVMRDKNHPSIILWSLGNESGYGASHDAMAGWMRHADPTRPIQYEGALRFQLDDAGHATDVVCPMYAPIDEIVAWARRTRDDRPLILCEYAHAMGNSCGSLADYWHAFREHDGLQGGFIWDWKDQGLLAESDEGRPYFAYGGDYGETPHDANFCINGLVAPDGTPHPALHEWKKLAQPFRIEARDLAKGRIAIHNDQDFESLDWLEGRFEVSVDGRPVQTGKLPKLDIAPGDVRVVSLPIRRPERSRGQVALVTIRLTTRRECAWAPKGHEIGWEQLELPARTRRGRAPSIASRKTALPPLDVDRDDRFARVRGGTFELEVDLSEGLFHALRDEGTDILLLGPQLDVFRAPTDNDGVKAWKVPLSRALGRWLDWGLSEIAPEATKARVVAQRDGHARFDAEHRLVARGPDDAATGERTIRHVERWLARPDGWLTGRHDFTVGKALDDLPRLGLRLALRDGFEQVEWLGRGPHESYADRRAGAAFGRFAGRIDEQLHPYVVPQESGNKTDVRWLAIRRRNESGLLIVARDPIEASVLPYTAADLYRARHTHELTPRAETIVHLDCAQRGLGTASCGPDTLPAYRLRPGRHRLELALRTFGARDDPGELAAEARSALFETQGTSTG